MTPFPDLMRSLDDHLQAGMSQAGDVASRGRYVDALLGRAEQLYAEVLGNEVAAARHAGAARQAHKRATAAKGRCRR